MAKLQQEEKCVPQPRVTSSLVLGAVSWDIRNGDVKMETVAYSILPQERFLSSGSQVDRGASLQP